MKEKFINWFGRNRKLIGYTTGGLNLFASVSYLVQGHVADSIVWLVIGGLIIFDTKEFK